MGARSAAAALAQADRQARSASVQASQGAPAQPHSHTRSPQWPSPSAFELAGLARGLGQVMLMPVTITRSASAAGGRDATECMHAHPASCLPPRCYRSWSPGHCQPGGDAHSLIVFTPLSVHASSMSRTHASIAPFTNTPCRPFSCRWGAAPAASERSAEASQEASRRPNPSCVRSLPSGMRCTAHSPAPLPTPRHHPPRVTTHPAPPPTHARKHAHSGALGRASRGSAC